MKINIHIQEYALLSMAAFFIITAGSVSLKAEESCLLDRARTLELIRNNNLSSKIAQTQMIKSQKNSEFAKSVYDQNISIAAKHTLDKSDRVVSFMGTKDEITSISTQYRKAFSSGTQVYGGITSTRQSNNGPFTTVNPAFDTVLSFGVRQPLVNNAFGRQFRNDVEIAEKLAKSETKSLERKQEELAIEILFEYWNWIAKHQDLLLLKQATKRAQDFLQITKSQLQYGTSESTDYYAAQSNYLSQLEDQTRAENDVDNSYQMLSFYLQLDSENVACKSSHENLYKEIDYSLFSDPESAKESRTDRDSLKIALDLTKIQVQKNQNNQLPNLDLVSSLDLNAVDGNWSDSMGKSFSSYHPKWFIGAEFSIPLEKRKEKTQLIQAQLDEKIAKIRIQELDAHIEKLIETKISTLKSLEKRIRDINQVVDFESKKLQSAKRDYQLGRQTALTVILYQQDLIRVNRRKLSLELEYRLSLEELQFIRGEIL
ncbi:MAG: TolC family protein [Bdellovibrionales bacterium]|nr:TolC family protein [Bdellovibrionales bacterium]